MPCLRCGGRDWGANDRRAAKIRDVKFAREPPTGPLRRGSLRRSESTIGERAFGGAEAIKSGTGNELTAQRLSGGCLK